MTVIIIERQNEIKIKDIGSLQQENLIIQRIQEYLFLNGYQRISHYARKEQGGGKIEVMCNAKKLKNQEVGIAKNEIVEFYPDQIIGKWVILCECAVEQDFLDGMEQYCNVEGKTVHFLPNGNGYPNFRWSKGVLQINYGGVPLLHEYKVKKIENKRYMFVEYKSRFYRQGGNPTVLVLKEVR